MNYDQELLNKILEVVDQTIRPSLAADGGDISVMSLEGNSVYVKLSGACSGCPMASVTLKNTVERIIQKHVSSDLVVLAV
ncbi:MAG: NifU family protein [Holosporaceae bacterium]|nr:NifU family protein [Holosporaceae bacterium]